MKKSIKRNKDTSAFGREHKKLLTLRRRNNKRDTLIQLSKLKRAFPRRGKPHWVGDYKRYPVSNIYYSYGISPPKVMDKDQDRVVNWEDCNPNNKNEQGFLRTIIDEIRGRKKTPTTPSPSLGTIYLKPSEASKAEAISKQSGAQVQVVGGSVSNPQIISTTTYSGGRTITHSGGGSGGSSTNASRIRQNAQKKIEAQKLAQKLKREQAIRQKNIAQAIRQRNLKLATLLKKQQQNSQKLLRSQQEKQRKLNLTISNLKQISPQNLRKKYLDSTKPILPFIPTRKKLLSKPKKLRPSQIKKEIKKLNEQRDKLFTQLNKINSQYGNKTLNQTQYNSYLKKIQPIKVKYNDYLNKKSNLVSQLPKKKVSPSTNTNPFTGEKVMSLDVKDNRLNTKIQRGINKAETNLIRGKNKIGSNVALNALEIAKLAKSTAIGVVTAPYTIPRSIFKFVKNPRTIKNVPKGIKRYGTVTGKLVRVAPAAGLLKLGVDSYFMVEMGKGTVNLIGRGSIKESGLFRNAKEYKFRVKKINDIAPENRLTVTLEKPSKLKKLDIENEAKLDLASDAISKKLQEKANSKLPPKQESIMKDVIKSKLRERFYPEEKLSSKDISSVEKNVGSRVQIKKLLKKTKTKPKFNREINIEKLKKMYDVKKRIEEYTQRLSREMQKRSGIKLDQYHESLLEKAIRSKLEKAVEEKIKQKPKRLNLATESKRIKLKERASKFLNKISKQVKRKLIGKTKPKFYREINIEELKRKNSMDRKLNDLSSKISKTIQEVKGVKLNSYLNSKLEALIKKKLKAKLKEQNEIIKVQIPKQYVSTNEANPLNVKLSVIKLNKNKNPTKATVTGLTAGFILSNKPLNKNNLDIIKKFKFSEGQSKSVLLPPRSKTITLNKNYKVISLQKPEVKSLNKRKRTISLNKQKPSSLNKAKLKQIKISKLKKRSLKNKARLEKKKRLLIIAKRLAKQKKISYAQILRQLNKQKTLMAKENFLKNLQKNTSPFLYKVATRQKSKSRQRAINESKKKIIIPRRKKSQKKPLKSKKNLAYNVYIKSGSRWVKANTRPLSRINAENRRAYVINNTTAVTGKIVPISKTKKLGIITSKESGARKKIIARDYKIVKGKKVKLQNTIIERRGRPRINRRGEVKGLSAAKLIKKLKESETKKKAVKKKKTKKTSKRKNLKVSKSSNKKRK